MDLEKFFDGVNHDVLMAGVARQMPLRSNILLTDLDLELEKRQLSFCRYADDCNIYVRSQRSGQRVM